MSIFMGWCKGKRLVFEFVPRSPHRINHEKLLAYVKEHPDAYLREIAAHFSVGLTTIWNALHRLGVRYKKTKNLPRIDPGKAEKICRIPKKIRKKISWFLLMNQALTGIYIEIIVAL